MPDEFSLSLCVRPATHFLAVFFSQLAILPPLMPSPAPMTTSSSSLPLPSPCESRAFSPSPLAQVIHGSNPLLRQKKRKDLCPPMSPQIPLARHPSPLPLSGTLSRARSGECLSFLPLPPLCSRSLAQILAALLLHLTSPRSLTCSRQRSRTVTGERCYVLPVLRTALFLPRTGECLFLWPSPLSHVLQKKHCRCHTTFPP